MLTKNASATLKETLDSIQSFPEIVILDTGSTDDTLLIARSYPNVKVFEHSFIGFGPLRNKASNLASHDWILALDSDEVLSKDLLSEIALLSLQTPCSYTLPRHNFYNRKRILGCGWNPEKVARLYHRKYTQFSDAQVHESLLSLNHIALKSPLLHTPYRSTADFLSKMQHYSTLFAEQYRGKRSSSFGKAVICGLFAFFRSYILRRGIFDGKEGFVISFYNASTTFYKYLKLAELTTSIKLK